MIKLSKGLPFGGIPGIAAILMLAVSGNLQYAAITLLVGLLMAIVCIVSAIPIVGIIIQLAIYQLWMLPYIESLKLVPSEFWWIFELMVFMWVVVGIWINFKVIVMIFEHQKW